MDTRVLVGSAILFVASGSLVADDADPSPPTAVTEPARPIPTSTTKSPLIQRKGKRREQKETEGTEAPERFQADTILKSPYSVDGQPLEVDPD